MKAPRRRDLWMVVAGGLAAVAVALPAAASSASQANLPPIPGEKTAAFAIDASGTQDVQWHVAYTQDLGTCTGTTVSKGQEELRFATDERVRYKLVTIGRYAALEPETDTPRTPEILTRQKRHDSSFTVTYAGTDCPRPYPPLDTTDCGKWFDGTAQALELDYYEHWRSAHGAAGILLNPFEIKYQDSTDAYIRCPVLNSTRGALFPLLGDQVELPGLFARITVKRLLELGREDYVSLPGAHRRFEAKLYPNSLCDKSPDCTSSGTIDWELRIWRVN